MNLVICIINYRFSEIPTMEQTVVLEPPLYFSPENVHIWNTSFHPSQNIMACSLINGGIQMYIFVKSKRLKYSPDDVERVLNITTVHKGSVRWVTFNKEGTLLASCSEDKRLGFVDAQGKVAHIIKKAHNNPINRCQFVDEHIFMSGDDQGEIKLWDLRTTQCIFQAKQQGDTISGLRFDSEHSNILASSMDGTIAIYDVKKGTQSDQKLYALSDSIDEQLNGLQIMKDGKYIVCPSSQSSIVVFKRQDISNYVDRIQGIPGSVDCLLKINENSLISGSEDGFVRGLGFKPNKIVQTIGQHEQDENFPIQSLSLSYCGNIVASTSHDNSIKFYDISEFMKKRLNEKVKMQVKQEQSEQMDLASQSNQIKNEANNSDQDQVDQDSDDDSDYSDDSEMQEKPVKGKKKNNKTNIRNRQKEVKKDKQRSFFKGL